MSIENLGKEDLILLIEELKAAFGQPCLDLVDGFLSKRKTKEAPKQKKKGKQNEFDISKYRQRHVAMQLQYEGGPYYGFASQESGDCDDTVEKHLFEALTKLRLIQSRQTCQYSRCGRTDKGVSALGQTIAFSLRSSIPQSVELVPHHPCDSIEHISVKKQQRTQQKIEQPNQVSEQSSELVETEVSQVSEMDYCGMLNKTLPENIRVLGWTEVTADFSSRHSAASRTYRYFFLKGNRSVEQMQVAASYLIGDHDFRNLCKIDLGNVTNFRRVIYSAKILPFMSHQKRREFDSFYQDDEGYSHPCVEFNNEGEEEEVWMLEITGIAFLWHMIRCIMSILLMVGDGHEDPSVIQYLLDIDACPSKPQYNMADELPLVLHSCQFDNLHLQWQPSVLWHLTNHYQEIWERHAIAAARAKNALDFVLSCGVRHSDVVQLELDLLQKETRRLEKLRDKQNGRPNYHPLAANQNHNPAKKRRIEARDSEGSSLSNTSNSSSDNGIVKWGAALSNWKSRFSHSENDLRVVMPRNLSIHPHVPIRERSKGEEYLTRVTQLTGARKERYDRHIALQEGAEERNNQFFGTMRKQGSIHTSTSEE